jgi:hypothetical protein
MLVTDYETMMAATGSSAKTAARTMVLVPIGPEVLPKQPHEGRSATRSTSN